jgi:hypothetical protein
MYGDEKTFERWFKLELNKLNTGLVTHQKVLSQLLNEKTPSCPTRSGQTHFFDLKMLQVLKHKLSRTLQETLKLPIIFYYDHNVPDSCYISDKTAVTALYELGALAPGRTFVNNKLWISRPLVLQLTVDYPTIIQIAVY